MKKSNLKPNDKNVRKATLAKQTQVARDQRVVSVVNARPLPTPKKSENLAAQKQNVGASPMLAKTPAFGQGVPVRNDPDLKAIRKRIKQEELRLARVEDHKGTIRLVEHVPDCTTHYVSARLFPFDTLAGACLPQSQFTFPSAKLKVIASGAMTLGTSGVGYIVFCPKWGNNSGGVVYTQATSVGGLGTALSAYTNLGTANFPELPYAAASFGDDLQGRYLAGGIRAQYTGKLMDQNGMGFFHCDPNHSSVSGNTPAQLINLQHTKRRVVTGNVGVGENWVGQVIDNGPVLPSETNFAAAAQVWADPYMVFIATGIAGDQYYFEVVMHVELMGRVVPNETPSHSDPENFPVVDTAIKEAFETGPPQKEDSGGIIKAIGEGISNLMPRIVSTISGIKPLGGIVDGLMKMIPMTGSNAMLTGLNGWAKPTNLLEKSITYRPHVLSYDVVEDRKKIIAEGGGRGSNLWICPKQKWKNDFLDFITEWAITNNLTAEQVACQLTVNNGDAFGKPPMDDDDEDSEMEEAQSPATMDPPIPSDVKPVLPVVDRIIGSKDFLSPPGASTRHRFPNAPPGY